ncbi:putative zona pellucida sperm-binding protein 4-like [Triplophysa rosa]|uniref:Zona pellucida sperm-binding protein 4-like n=1 Tax=Triplophysa rosa TaxID=992332 RepID=A0A9W7WYK0_TRIRA|nr:putative zona pellucida sperm-binding protein 4-like [Triplophysa rosa]
MYYKPKTFISFFVLSTITHHLSAFKPLLNCFGNVMTLTTRGREYTHILVDRAGASPLYLFQLPSYCGYDVKVTRRALLLMAPFDGCYITQEDGENRLVIIVDGKQFTLSCPFPHHLSAFHPYLHSHPFHHPLQPNLKRKPFIPHVPGSIRVIGTMRHPTTPLKPETSKPPAVPYEPPLVTPPIHPTNIYQHPIPTRVSQNDIPGFSTFIHPTISHGTNEEEQTDLLPQIPISPPTEQPSKVTSPSLICTRNRMTATLPSAKMASIKVKETKTDSWMSIASVPASCNYTLRSRSGAVVLSSPLPACHTQKLSSSVTSLFIRFWDSSQMRTRTIHLQCRHALLPDALEPFHQIIPRTTSTPASARQPPNVQVLCSSQHMSVKVPPGPIFSLLVEAPSSGIKTQIKAVPLLEAASHCGYSLKRDKDGAFNILLPYSSCHMTQQDGQHKIILKYETPDGRPVETLLSCQASDSQECNVIPDQQLVCGSGALSSTECHDKGCCYSLDTQLCYYPMDECTADHHFVFSVNSSVANPPLSPSTLVTAGNSSCSPEKVTADFALFKIPLDECGVHRYEVGKTVIYMVEILNRVQSVSLNYGTITRDSPVRLLVECRYYPGSVVSVGYLVKSPSLGPAIKAQGVFGVQLRIAKDEYYNDFYPQYHQPLRMLLGKPLYLEVRLMNPPDPTALLLVHYCVAYPRSAKSAWILIYDGCPNSLDQTPTHTPPATPAEALTNQVRRFTVTTFKFLPEDDSLQTNEEIYFMCSTEVCLPSDGPCIEGCFEGK